jgi:Flp pilus assembly protein CpaB
MGSEHKVGKHGRLSAAKQIRGLHQEWGQSGAASGEPRTQKNASRRSTAPAAGWTAEDNDNLNSAALVRRAIIVAGRNARESLATGECTLSRPTVHLVRSAQIHASTVFAVTLAIVAGLLFAGVFKMYFLNNKPKVVQAPPPPTYRLTVAAVNLPDKTLILPSNVKTIAVGEEEYKTVMDSAKSKNMTVLRGSQPVNRTTVKPIKAEEPIFEEQLEPLEYPKPVSTTLRPGKRASIIEVPAKNAMLQVGDHVDVLCTLSNSAAVFGPGATATAVLAKNSRVVARFNSTRTAASPNTGDNRTYTLEMTPYRYALVELSKSLGATFALSVVARPSEESSSQIARDMDLEQNDPQTDRVTATDLAKLFGIVMARPERAWEIERWSGITQRDSIYYEDYQPAGKATGKTAERAMPAIPAPSLKTQRPASGRPISGAPTGPSTSSSRSRSVPAASFDASETYAAASDNLGFKAPMGPAKKCCGRK